MTSTRDSWLAAQRPVVHWQKPAAPPRTAICHGRQTTAPTTTRRQDVTCGTCRQSRGWRTP
jgi:hypothetical protein